MKISSSIQSFLLLLGTLFFVSHIDLTEARGGRGGGGGRGGRGGRYSGGSRGGSGSRSSSYRTGVRNSRYGGFSSRTAFKTALLAGTIYGARRYMRRRTYISNPDNDPTICVNYNLKEENQTTSWGRFICPMWNEGEDHEWCCGPENEEHCCTFWDDAGRTAGTIIGIIVGVLVVVAVVACCCCKGKTGSVRSHKKTTTRSTEPEQYSVQYSRPATGEGEKAGLPPNNPADATAPPYPTKMDPPPPQYGFSTNVQPPPPYGMN